MEVEAAWPVLCPRPKRIRDSAERRPHAWLRERALGFRGRWLNWGRSGVSTLGSWRRLTMPTHPMPCWPHSTPGLPLPGLVSLPPTKVPERGSTSRIGAELVPRSGPCLVPSPGQGGPPQEGDGWAGAPGRGTLSAGTRSTAGHGEGWVCLGTSRLVVSLAQPSPASNHKPAAAFRIHTSVHHNTDKFPPFDYLRKISRVLTWGPIHPRVPGPSPTDATRPSPALPSWPEEAHRPTPQPVWAPQGWRLCTGHGVPHRARPSSTSAPRDAALPKRS